MDPDGTKTKSLVSKEEKKNPRKDKVKINELQNRDDQSKSPKENKTKNDCNPFHFRQMRALREHSEQTDQALRQTCPPTEELGLKS